MMGLHMEYIKKKFSHILDWKGKVAASQLYWWSFQAAAPETQPERWGPLRSGSSIAQLPNETKDEEQNSAFRILVLVFDS